MVAADVAVLSTTPRIASIDVVALGLRGRGARGLAGFILTSPPVVVLAAVVASVAVNPVLIGTVRVVPKLLVIMDCDDVNIADGSLFNVWMLPLAAAMSGWSDELLNTAMSMGVDVDDVLAAGTDALGAQVFLIFVQ